MTQAVEEAHRFLYCIAPAAHRDGPCKLGISHDPDARLRQLQTAHPETLMVHHREMVAAFKAPDFERLLHRDIAYRRRKGEWFDLNVEDAIAHIMFTVIHYDSVSDLRRKRKLGRI